jgi:hypothetical protein
MREQGPFTLTAANAPFAILPGLVLMFTLGPAATPQMPLPVSALILGFVGAILGLVTYRFVADYGPLARIGALTLLCAVLGIGAMLLTGAG